MKSATQNRALFVVPVFGGVNARIISGLSSNNKCIHILTLEEQCNGEIIQNCHHYENKSSNEYGWISKIRLTWNRARYIKRLTYDEKINTAVGFYKRSTVPIIFSSMLGAKIRTVVTVRNNPREKFGKINGRMVAFLYRFADCVVTNSEAAAHICRSEYGLKNVTTIYNPVDYQKIKIKSEESLPQEYKSIFESGKVFINIGRLSPQKGQWHLIRAFKKVVEDHPKAKLIILGEGKLRPKLQSLIEKCGLKENVFLLGNQENVFPFLKAADCFVLSSLHEGLPNVVLEAKAIGIPIISTDCKTGPREIFAPEVSVDEKITYPYKVGDSVIVKPLSGKRIYKNISDHHLEPAEQMLAKSMLKQASKPASQKEFNIDERFNPETVVKQWQGIV